MNQNLSEAAMNWVLQIWDGAFVNNYFQYISLKLKAHPDEEVDHEEDVEGKVNLLGGVLNPGSACLHTIPANKDWIKSDKKVKVK